VLRVGGKGPQSRAKGQTTCIRRLIPKSRLQIRAGVKASPIAEHTALQNVPLFRFSSRNFCFGGSNVGEVSSHASVYVLLYERQLFCRTARDFWDGPIICFTHGYLVKLYQRNYCFLIAVSSRMPACAKLITSHHY
jgi:hypothetical protein